MAHLTAPNTKRTIDSVEVVSDDSTKVLRFNVTDKGVATITLRDATASHWSATQIATLDRRDAEVVATILTGGSISEYGNAKETIDALPTSYHTLEKPEADKPVTDSDCTALDIERAKAENIREQKQLVELELERDHARDYHTTASVPGCLACERAIYPGHGDGSLPQRTYLEASAEDDDLPETSSSVGDGAF